MLNMASWVQRSYGARLRLRAAPARRALALFSAYRVDCLGQHQRGITRSTQPSCCNYAFSIATALKKAGITLSLAHLAKHERLAIQGAMVLRINARHEEGWRARRTAWHIARIEAAMAWRGIKLLHAGAHRSWHGSSLLPRYIS
jgi:hypothetical protein